MVVTTCSIAELPQLVTIDGVSRDFAVRLNFRIYLDLEFNFENNIILNIIITLLLQYTSAKSFQEFCIF
jgi:hypothetical protein